jgi:two-component system response regulator PilR (NtrC family)
LQEAYLGNSTEAEVVRRLIVRAARAEHPVLVQGETGTGKEVVARQIHLLSGRAAESFVEVNCGGIPGELLESELFGHRRGAFTGATRNKPGLWTLANKGTLFLDEIGDLSLHHQVKILRALETGRYRPVGEVDDVTSRARIITATNRDLAHMVSAGQFREDLYYRLFTFRIRTPALREHPDDIPELANHFWRRIAGATAKPIPVAVTEALKRYHWPGNARELRAFLINVFLLVDHHSVDVPLIRAVMQDRLGYAVQINPDQ